MGIIYWNGRRHYTSCVITNDDGFYTMSTFKSRDDTLTFFPPCFEKLSDLVKWLESKKEYYMYVHKLSI